MRPVPLVLTLTALVWYGAPAVPAAPVKPASAKATASSGGSGWKQVHPRWRDAVLLSFRSPDLLTNDPDERWGRDDGRLVCGLILTDFRNWLEYHRDTLEAARAEGRPILLSLHVHGGYGTGLVTYRRDLQRAEVANYPWLIRQLIDTGFAEPDVTVTVDTCNAQASAAHQLRPDLVPRGVEAWSVFARWRRADAARRKLPFGEAYRVFSQDKVRHELVGRARASRSNVQAAPLAYLTREERSRFRARLFGPHGVIYSTPALFNLLRLGGSAPGTLTSNLLTDRLKTSVVDGLLAQNKAELRKFREYAYFTSARVDLRSLPGNWTQPDTGTPVAQTVSRENRIERGMGTTEQVEDQ